MPDPAGSVPLSLLEKLSRPTDEVLRDLGLLPLLNPRDVYVENDPKGHNSGSSKADGPTTTDGHGHEIPANTNPFVNTDAMLKPVTDLLSMFGSGKFGGLDPTKLMDGLGKTLQQGMDQMSGGMKGIGGSWQGSDAINALAKSAEANANAGEIAGQTAGMRSTTALGVEAVQEAVAKITEIISTFQTFIAALGPWIITISGSSAAAAAAAQALARTTEAVAQARALLAGYTGKMAGFAPKVPVTRPPLPATGLPTGALGNVLSSVIGPVTQAATAGPQAGGQMIGHIAQSLAKLGGESDSKLNAYKSSAVDLMKAATSHPSGADGPLPAMPLGHAASVTGGGTGGAHGGVSAGKGSSSLLGKPTVMGAVAGTHSATSAPSVRDAVPIRDAGLTAGRSGVMGGGMGAMHPAMRGAGADGKEHFTPDYLITAHTGAAILGETEIADHTELLTDATDTLDRTDERTSP